MSTRKFAASTIAVLQQKHPKKRSGDVAFQVVSTNAYESNTNAADSWLSFHHSYPEWKRTAPNLFWGIVFFWLFVHQLLRSTSRSTCDVTLEIILKKNRKHLHFTYFASRFPFFGWHFLRFYRCSRECRITLQVLEKLPILSSKVGIFAIRKCKK